MIPSNRGIPGYKILTHGPRFAGCQRIDQNALWRKMPFEQFHVFCRHRLATQVNEANGGKLFSFAEDTSAVDERESEPNNKANFSFVQPASQPCQSLVSGVSVGKSPAPLSSAPNMTRTDALN